MIYTVTFNPSLDYVIAVKDFKAGKINKTSEEDIFAGGKGINVSIMLQTLGIKSTALGFVAGFTGKEIIDQLSKKNIDTDFIEVDGLSRFNVKLRSNEETEINGMGPKITANDVSKLYEKLDKLKAGDYLVLAGSIPPSLSSSMYMDIMKRLEGKEIKIIVDASKDLLKKVLPYKPYLIKPNNIELGEIFDVELNTVDDVIPYAQKLQEMGAQNVLVSLAKDGAVLVSEDGAIHKASAPSGKVINSVGAGDSMVAGFLSEISKKNDYNLALLTGICAGSASAFSTYFGTKAKIFNLLQNYKNQY